MVRSRGLPPLCSTPAVFVAATASCALFLTLLLNLRRPLLLHRLRARLLHLLRVEFRARLLDLLRWPWLLHRLRTRLLRLLWIECRAWLLNLLRHWLRVARTKLGPYLRRVLRRLRLRRHRGLRPTA